MYRVQYDMETIYIYYIMHIYNTRTSMHSTMCVAMHVYVIYILIISIIVPVCTHTRPGP